MSAETVCRVCGYEDGDVRWDDFDCPNYVICDSCGAESGYEDTLLKAVRAHRQRWLQAGAPWWGRKVPPAGWQAPEQLKRVPMEWR